VLTLAKLGREQEIREALEPITSKLDVIENGAYHRLLMHFKGELDEPVLLSTAASESNKATLGYGVASWRLYRARKVDGIKKLREIVAGSEWAAFGYIAAEADLKRMGLEP
jgi:hypothetical protein